MIRFIDNHIWACLAVFAVIISFIAYYFQVIRYERRELKKRQEKDTFFDTKKFKNNNNN